MPETPPPMTSSPTASEEDTDDGRNQLPTGPSGLDQAPRTAAATAPFQLKKRPLAERLILAGSIAPEVLVVSREEYNAVLLELQRLNDSGGCGRMVEGIVAKMEKWNP